MFVSARGARARPRMPPIPRTIPQFAQVMTPAAVESEDTGDSYFISIKAISIDIQLTVKKRNMNVSDFNRLALNHCS